MARAFQQFSRFRLGKDLPTEHHLLQQHQVGERGDVLEPLALELGEPAEGFREPEEAVRHVELVLSLFSRPRDVQRPGGRDARLTRLDKLRDGDVDDTLAAGLGTGDAEQAVNLPAGTLACGPGELVAEKGINRVNQPAWCKAYCYSPFRMAG